MNVSLRTLVGVLLLALAGCGGGDAGRAAPTADPTATAPTDDPTDVAADVGADRPIRLEEVWRWPAPPSGSVGMPTADGDGVAFTYGHIRLALLDLDGELRWEADRAGLRDVAPAFASGLVVAATEEGLMAVDRGTGQLRWDSQVGERANTPVIAHGRAVASTWDGSLTAFDLADGRVAWRTPLPGLAIGPAATDGEAVVVTWEARHGAGAGVMAVAAADGHELWSVPLEPGGVGGPAIVELPSGGQGEGGASVVVFVAGDIAAHGLDLVDGTERWRTQTDGRGSPEVPPLALGHGEVLVPDRLAGLTLLDAITGDAIGHSSAGGVATRGGAVGNPPDGPFAFPTDDGRVALVGIGYESDALDWPGRVSGVALAPGGLLLVATREARANHLIALTGM